MRKLLTGFAAVSTLALLASAAQADCFGNHNVSASVDEQTPVAAMSTYEGPSAPPVEETDEADASTPVCAEDEKDCAPATE